MSDQLKFEVLIYCAGLLCIVAGLGSHFDLNLLMQTALGLQ